MAKINKGLLRRLASRLGVSESRVYALIAKKATATGLDRHLAALLVAADHGVNYQKFSTSEERAQIRGVVGGAGPTVATGVGEANLQPQTRRAKIKKAVRVPKPRDNSVFVVHGRNESLRRSLFDLLRALGLKPLEWEKVVQMTRKTNPYVGDILDKVMAKVQAVVVLFSPDDEARLKPEFLSKSDPTSEKRLVGQPRPNVLFEAGLALGHHPRKTIIVEVGRLRKFSDIAGRHVVRLTNDLARRNELANRLQTAGCKVDKTGLDWTKAGDFTA